jgi:hypothetical protein
MLCQASLTHKSPSPLPLLVAGVGRADHVDDPAAADDLAVLADLFD